MTTTYFKNVRAAAATLSKGLKLTFKHILEARKSSKPVAISNDQYFEEFDKGISTLQYPHETMPVPDNGRYRLHNEIDDCIVCDKCAKVCPVDCIDIEGIKATEVIGKTSDGTPKRIHAAKFDIDMSKCCFCGLCTTVCPTECLTMTKAYDFSEFDFKEHTYSFATMTPLEILEKKKELEEFEAKKDQVAPTEDSSTPASKPRPKPQPRPAVKEQPVAEGEPGKKTTVKPKMTSPKPVMKPKPVVKSKPVVKPKPVIKRKKDEND